MKTSTSTYWLFYLKDPSVLTPEQLRGTELDGGFLYAYTDKKKYAKEWERERNMQLFRLRRTFEKLPNSIKMEESERFMEKRMMRKWVTVPFRSH